jgi:hypothetical protein
VDPVLVFVKAHPQDKHSEMEEMQAKDPVEQSTAGLANLDQSAFFDIRKSREDVLKDLSQPCGINTCHSRGKPSFAYSPPFGIQVNSGVPWRGH